MPPRFAATALRTVALSTALLAGPALAFDPAAMSDAERDAFRAEVRAYLIDNPEVLMEAIAVLEQREATAKVVEDRALVTANAAEIFDDGHSWTGGNPDGDVILVEFVDYRCGYCRRAEADVAKLVETDGNIKLILKEFPILGEASTISSRFAIATKLEAGDEAYKSMHDALITLNADPTDTVLTRLADGLGLDGAAILARMSDPEVDRILEANNLLARRLNISGTPTFVMNDEMLRGYAPYDAMVEIVAGKRG